MNGTSVSHGPHVHSRLTNAPISAAHNHGRSLTYRMPSFVSAQNEASSAGSRSVGRAWISMIITAENANVSASAMNAHPAPTLPTSRPPINGPTSVMANGRTNCPSEFASTSSSAGTMLGTIDENAGPNSA